MNLKFTRKLSKSVANDAAQITIPRPIAQAWQDFDCVLMVFDGTNLILTPQEE
jgi:hypothetical protein